jgi:arginine-tRNA-protein transferase
MSQFDKTLRSQFFLTGPRPCPYLPDRQERKLFTTLSGPNASEVHDNLSAVGFRRSQNIAYRPACDGCNACKSTRVRAFDFRMIRSQKRIARRNRDVIVTTEDPWATEEQYALFKRYVTHRHPGGGMSDMNAYDYAAMVEESPVRSVIFEYRVADASGGTGELIGACITDILGDGLSLVYSFFDPDASKKRSIGNFIILDHIARAIQNRFPFVYLGYWVSGSDTMDYKINFSPIEILTKAGWQDQNIADQNETGDA